MRYEIKEYDMGCNNSDLRSLWATPTFCNHTLVSANVWKQHPCFVCAGIRPYTGLHRATPINCYSCCRLQMYYPCSMTASHWITAVQSTCITHLYHTHLFKARPGACKLAGATYTLCTTPIDPSLYLFFSVMASICIAMYLQFAYGTNQLQHCTMRSRVVANLGKAQY